MADTGIAKQAHEVPRRDTSGQRDNATGRVNSASFLRILVFAGGFASIGVELTASRLVAPYFGSSTFIWASLIGLTLAFLSLGYVLGGRLADRRPDPTVLYTVAAVAAVAIGTIPFVARPMLTGSLEAFNELDAGAFYGTLVGTLLLLAPPITLLGFISPFAIRLQLSDVASAGETAGSLYALSTIGSITGSFVPVLVLIPTIGTAATFIVLSLVLLVPAVAGLVAARARAVALATALAALAIPALSLAAPSGVRPPDRGVLIHERESAYNYIQVVDEGGRRSLILNEGRAVHSVYDPDKLLTGGPWDYFMVAPLLVDGRNAPAPRDALLIGLAGGTVARQLTAAYGPIPIAGVEIDPEIDRVAREYFALDELANVEVIVADGRYALKSSDATFDLIGVDAYRQPYIPFQLTSREFFQEVSDHLRPGGVAVVNAGRTSTDFRLVEALGATMRDVFPHVVAIDVDRYTNTILVGSDTPLSAESLVQNIEGLADASPVREVAGWSLTSGNIRVIKPGGLVFTDDRAPVELVIDQMILDAAREITTP
ncbi:MAG: fused MFS/spermidine synthase [Chloroflexi bacterium]|nr:fused MFS/spermidine synthase [Chloroflexota bacterium]